MVTRFCELLGTRSCNRESLTGAALIALIHCILCMHSLLFSKLKECKLLAKSSLSPWCGIGKFHVTKGHAYTACSPSWHMYWIIPGKNTIHVQVHNLMHMNNVYTAMHGHGTVCAPAKGLEKTPDLGHMYMYIHKLLVTTCTQECTIMCREDL